MCLGGLLLVLGSIPNDIGTMVLLIFVRSMIILKR